MNFMCVWCLMSLSALASADNPPGCLDTVLWSRQFRPQGLKHNDVLWPAFVAAKPSCGTQSIIWQIIKQTMVLLDSVMPAPRSSNHLQIVCDFSACLKTVLATSVSLTFESSCSSVSFEQSDSQSLMQTHGIKQIPKWCIRVTWQLWSLWSHAFLHVLMNTPFADLNFVHSTMVWIFNNVVNLSWRQEGQHKIDHGSRVMSTASITVISTSGSN